MMIVACAVPLKWLLIHPNRMLVRNAFLNTVVIPHFTNPSAPWKGGGANARHFSGNHCLLRQTVGDDAVAGGGGFECCLIAIAKDDSVFDRL